MRKSSILILALLGLHALHVKKTSCPEISLSETDADTMLFIADNDELYEQLKTKLIFRGYDVHCIRTDDYARSDYYSPLLNVRTIEDVERIALRISSEEERYLMTAFLEFAACDVGTFAEARELAEMTAEGEFELVEERFGHDGYMLNDAHERFLQEVYKEDDFDEVQEIALRCSRKIASAMSGLIELSGDRDDTDILHAGERRQAYFIISDEPAGKIAAEQIVSRTDCAASIDTDDDEYAGIIKDAREIYTRSGGKL